MSAYARWQMCQKIKQRLVRELSESPSLDQWIAAVNKAAQP